MTTWHNDNNRTGWQQSESTLTPSALTTCNSQPCFGLLWQWTGISGPVYAQPLAVAGLPTIGGCTSPCSLVFIATEQDMLYAFNASSNSQTPIWSTDLAANVGDTYVNCVGLVPSFAPCQTQPVGPTVGVTGTPVIDTNSNLLYVVGAVQNGQVSVGYELFAVDITTGNVQGSIAIGGTVSGQAPPPPPPGLCTSTYPGNPGSTISFDSSHIQRAGLLLLNHNLVYVAFSANPPEENLNGWLFGYRYSNPTFTPVTPFVPTPFGTGGGIWQSGAALAAEVKQDGTTYIYAASGNGTFDAAATQPVGNDVGNSLVKIQVNTSTGAMTGVDYYSPFNMNTYLGDGVCEEDADFGSGGVLLFPEAFYHDLNNANGHAYPNMSVEGDKQSVLYTLDRDHLGKFNTNGGNLLELSQIRFPVETDQGFWSTPAYWKYVDSGSNPHYYLYASVSTDSKPQRPFPMDMYQLATSGTSGPIGAISSSTNALFCFSTTPTVSSSGTNGGGIVWAIENRNFDNPLNPDCNGSVLSAGLHALDATNFQNELYSSRNLNAGLGLASTFSSPTVFQGRVYVGTQTKVNVFGLCATQSGGCKQ